MADLQSLSVYPVGAQPERPVEEITVKAEKANQDGFTFWDFLDVINPLQHIPVVNTLYREMTGDEIKAPAKMIGSAIIGGPIGLAVAMVDSAIEDTTGKDIGRHALAMFRQEGDGSDRQNNNTGPDAAPTLSSAATMPREFIPTASIGDGADLNQAQGELAGAASVQANMQTEAAIAASAARTPQGMVFMPLPGRQSSNVFNPLPKIQNSGQFFSLDRTQSRGTPEFEKPSANQTPNINPVALAQLQAQGVLPNTTNEEPKSLDPLLSATKPQTETGKLPAADPFAAARLLAEETDPVMVPAWFDKAMMDAMGKYKAMQNVGS
jgi:hypothetical protein